VRRRAQCAKLGSSVRGHEPYGVSKHAPSRVDVELSPMFAIEAGAAIGFSLGWLLRKVTRRIV